MGTGVGTHKTGFDQVFNSVKISRTEHIGHKNLRKGL